MCLRVDGATSLPWPALQAALAAHFADDVFVSHQPQALVGFVYGSVISVAWSQASRGRDSWRILLGGGHVASVMARRGDGSPIDPPRTAADLHTFVATWERGTAVSPRKRLRGPSSPEPASSRSSRDARASLPGGAAPAGAAPRPWPSRPITTLPQVRGAARALVAPRYQARRGPGNL